MKKKLFLVAAFLSGVMLNGSACYIPRAPNFDISHVLPFGIEQATYIVNSTMESINNDCWPDKYTKIANECDKIDESFKYKSKYSITGCESYRYVKMEDIQEIFEYLWKSLERDFGYDEDITQYRKLYFESVQKFKEHVAQERTGVDTRSKNDNSVSLLTLGQILTVLSERLFLGNIHKERWIIAVWMVEILARLGGSYEMYYYWFQGMINLSYDALGGNGQIDFMRKHTLRAN